MDVNVKSMIHGYVYKVLNNIYIIIPSLKYQPELCVIDYFF